MHILFVLFGLVFLLAILINLFIANSYKQQKENLDEDFEVFKTAIISNDIRLIKKVGNTLVHNKFLKQEQLKFISNEFEQRVDFDEEFKKLSLKAFNKQLHYDRPLPPDFDP